MKLDLESNYKTNKGSSTGTETGYTVEARLDYLRPDVIAGQVLDTRWAQLAFAESPIGIPIKKDPMRFGGVGSTLLSYPAAQALRWWFHAVADAEHKNHCLETRLVAHKLTYNTNVEAVSAHEFISGEDRSNAMPDWNTKP